ncbi:MAG: glutaredoxin domain-containing protein [Patescibacteria group bacterium]
MAKSVSIYTTPTCVYCKMTKDFFKQNNVEYQEFDVASNLEKRKEMIEKSGQMGVPVVFIDSEIMIGFDKGKLMQLLGIK